MTEPTISLSSGSKEFPDLGLALCLSGGGYRATLFHLGSLRRLNELGVLSRIAVVTSVSGGSILNGILATRWKCLRVDGAGVATNFEDEIASPIRRFCGRDLRTRLLFGIRLNPANWPALMRDFGSVSANFLAEEYERLFKKTPLADLPVPGEHAPRFVFCATSVQTGACWHFHGGPAARMGDFYTGYFEVGDVKVAQAVASSSAFPPGFGALRLRLPENAAPSRIDPWGQERPASLKRQDLSGRLRCILLTDGGVYDNLGVEPVWNRCRAFLVSDAGRPFSQASEPSQGLISRLRRAFEISSEQVGAVRKRWLVGELAQKKCQGALWAINTRLQDFPLADAQGYVGASSGLLSAIRTDLNAFSEGEIACLENHGYALADAALRSRAPELCQNLNSPFRWPHDKWCAEDAVRSALRRSESRRIFHDLWQILIG